MRIALVILVLGFALPGAGQEVNKKNEDGEKVGLWQYTKTDTVKFIGMDTVSKGNNSGWRTEVIDFVLLEGRYENGKKNGEWTSYDVGIYHVRSLNGKSHEQFIRAVVTYVNDLPAGKLKTYHRNDSLMLEGIVEREEEKVKLKSYSKDGVYYGEKMLEIKRVIDDYTNMHLAETN